MIRPDPPATGYLADCAAVERLGAMIASQLRPGEALCLHGPLGAGKSTLARGLIRALTHADEDVPSPTFTLVQSYATANGAVAHFDLYRLSHGDEALEIGLDEALETGAVVIEWPERLGERQPLDRLDVRLAFVPNTDEGRCVMISGQGSWAGRAEALVREMAWS